ARPPPRRRARARRRPGRGGRLVRGRDLGARPAAPPRRGGAEAGDAARPVPRARRDPHAPVVTRRLALVLILAAALAGPAATATRAPIFPVAGELDASAVVVHSRPDPPSPAVTVLHRFRSVFREQIVFAEMQATVADGHA